jgi:lipopolysaccharide/colanic/teichoic acid biosynthesis glycosyltransferase
MQSAATQVDSLEGETSQRSSCTQNVSVAGAAVAIAGTAVADGEQFRPPEAVQVAVCQQVVSGEVAVAVDAPKMLAAAFDPAALAEEFRDFDLQLSTLVCLAVKRAFDVAAATVALVVLSPLLVVVALLVKLSDGGPVFFAQTRVGLRGRTFRMLKFRSMVVHAERLRPRLEVRNESNGPVFKMKLDPRMTPIGKLLRRYSLDELPQLINVLRGEMSIVGPRPSLPREVARYEPWQYRRFAVRPGLTCLWQVSAGRYRISFDDWMRLDLKYVDEWSLRLDFGLVLRTFGVVLRGTGE